MNCTPRGGSIDDSCRRCGVRALDAPVAQPIWNYCSGMSHAGKQRRPKSSLWRTAARNRSRRIPPYTRFNHGFSRWHCGCKGGGKGLSLEIKDFPHRQIQSGGDGGTPGGFGAEYRRESKMTIGWVVKVQAAESLIAATICCQINNRTYFLLCQVGKEKERGETSIDGINASDPFSH